jgi:CDP-glycerol glycerophosphotransferase (TagB/SpsB family)
MEKKYIWLFGENLGNTANNNSFYFWKQCVDKEDEIEKYFILSKSAKNKQIYETLTDNEKKHVIWKNSLKHYQYYRNADMFFVSLSYKDIQPIKGGGALNAPVIYLQHGTTGIKKIGYSGDSYNNHLYKFIFYNTEMYQKFQEENNFKEYQLYYGKYHPRYQEFVKKQKAYKEKQNQILWFITWREYFGKNQETDQFLRTIKRTIENEKLNEYLQKHNLTIKLCMHMLFTQEHKNYLRENLKNTNIEIVDSNKIDVMDEMVKSKLLITDYSSVGFDFAFLGKPVVLFQPDRDIYLKGRNIYCSYEELEQYSLETSSQLVRYIIHGNYKMNEFFTKRLPEKIDYDYVLKGKHIDKMYEDIKKAQLNKVVFLGYNYFGRGGTVSATKSLAEGLLEKGYLVELLSLKKTTLINKGDFPCGCTVKSIYASSRKSKATILKRALFLRKKHYSYFKYDSNQKYLIPYVGYGLKKYLENVKASNVVSTRETIHFFLKDSKSPFIKNKVYFFHTDANLIEGIFPNVISKLNELELEKCAFVTELNRQRYIEKLNFDNYKDYAVVGNALTSSTIINKSEIEAPGKKAIYKGIYLTRVSKDRVNDVQNVINFGKYLKENNIHNIKIDVYGTGDYVNQFEDKIFDEEVDDYIFYKGLTKKPEIEIRNHDFTVDFSLNQSFGMSYIESTLNGSKVFAYPNYGSKEVLKEIPDSFIESYEELVSKINKLDSVTKKDLEKNYDIIMKKYSRGVVSDNFIKLLESEYEKK